MASFFHFASLYLLFSTLPLYVLHLGGSTFQVGLIIGVFSVTSLVVRPLFGAWMDRSGRRRFLLAGAAIYVVASLGYLAIRSVPELLLWRAFHAFGLATFSTAAASLAGDFAPVGLQGTTMGIYGLAQAGALSIGPWIGEALWRRLGYSGLFLGTALTALAALASALAVPEAHRRRDGHPIRRDRIAGGTFRRQIAPPAAMQFAASIAYGTIVSFVAVVARERRLSLVGTYFALLALSSLAIRLVAGRAYDAWGPSAVLAPAFLSLSAGMMLLAFTRNPPAFLAAAVLAGLGIGGTHTTLLSRVVETCTAGQRGSAVGVFTSCWELGVGGGAIIMGRLAQAAGFEGMYAVAAALPMVGLGGLRWLRESGVGSPSRVPRSSGPEGPGGTERGPGKGA